MAITIRTGANGSYKSAYTAYFVIYEALKAGRVVVTNIEGMETVASIEKRFDCKFPSTTKLLRISSRDEAGVFLWTHFFCWCPIGALIVIDECQDIYSKNIGFDMKKVKYQPLDTFITKDQGKDGLLPESYVDFFNSRYIPADMNELEESETDDRGVAQYDENGRIIYPHTFNEGFMRHRKYNWDIELLSPDWKQIDSGIKACGEQNFFHKGRDQFFWCKRKPLIWKHDKSVTTPVIPKKLDVNTFKKKIPLDAFLLYKSTGTGLAKQAGAMNTLFRSPKAIAALLLSIFCLGYLMYEISNRLIDSSEEDTQPQTSQSSSSVLGQSDSSSKTTGQSDSDVSTGGDSNQANHGDVVKSVYIGKILPFEGIQKAFVTSVTFAIKDNKINRYVNLEAITADGVYSLSEAFLDNYDISYRVIDQCLLELTRNGQRKMITCKPLEQRAQRPETMNAKVSLF
ncbi:toxin [Vibrio sp. T187]|uniref:zonular occludens toxin domain-containing protein n=1 Tax=Vibrio TaxID=662 RepID=UPI0010C99A4B|nr:MULTISPECIES: zonular occludens toxin domain-containing protein [Vibrio]MBW3698054.1 toxin [Vibrio sp. T187]